MAKRTRYSGRPAARPGAGRLGQGPASRPGIGPSPVRAAGLTELEVDRAAELEAELVARERAAIAENARRRGRPRPLDASIVGDAREPLSVRASHEYAYVARDVRRIVLTASLMFAILAGLWLVVNLGGGGLG